MGSHLRKFPLPPQLPSIQPIPKLRGCPQGSRQLDRTDGEVTSLETGPRMRLEGKARSAGEDTVGAQIRPKVRGNGEVGMGMRVGQ